MDPEESVGSINIRRKESLAEICPDFVIELRSPSDRVADVEAKMEEYIANGSRLGWLLDPIENRAIIYHPDELARTSG